MARRAPKSPSATSRGATPGNVVWAKLRGHPWWPCCIAPLSAVPEELAQSARLQNGTDDVAAVYFFGSHDYSLVPVSGLKPLDENWELYSRAGSGSSFARALREARDPERYLPPTMLSVSQKLAQSSRKVDGSDTEDSGADSKATPPLHKKPRGRPKSLPKSRVPGAPLDTTTFFKLCKLRLQRITLGAQIDVPDAEVALRTISAISKVAASLDSLAESQLGRVLRLAREREEWLGPNGAHPHLGKAIDNLLDTWRESLADYAATVGI